MIAISMFNNKGGVGKTTLTCNIASYIARYLSKRVLVVDCDPQCNSTQLMMGENQTYRLYQDKHFGRQYTTIRDILQPIEDGDSSISEDIRTIGREMNRFRVDLLPGHPGFSVIEDRLGAAWHELKGGDLGGIRRTNWNTFLCRKIQDRYDFAFFDLGPSLGSINRSVLIGCDTFVTPMGADIFSILGIRNIARWLETWMKQYDNGIELCQGESTGERLGDYQVADKLSIRSGYLGYTMQQYITKAKEGVRRPTKAYEEIINIVPSEIGDSLGDFFPDGLTVERAKLGDVPHLYSLIPLAQSVSAPIHDLKSADGLVGSQFKAREDYDAIIRSIVNNLMNNLKQTQRDS